MVGKTLDGRILEFNFGDIITTKVPGVYYTLQSYGSSNLSFISHSNQHGPEVAKYKTAELPSFMHEVIPMHKIGKEYVKPTLNDVLKELELPNIDNIFPKSERIDLNGDVVEVNVEDVINRYTKAVMLLEYMEQVVNHLFNRSEPKNSLKETSTNPAFLEDPQNLRQFLNDYIVKTPNYATSFNSSSYIDDRPVPSPKKVARKTRSTDKAEKIDTFGEIKSSSSVVDGD